MYSGVLLHEISHNLCKIKCCCKLKMEQIDFSSSSFAQLPESKPATYICAICAIYVLHTKPYECYKTWRQPRWVAPDRHFATRQDLASPCGAWEEQSSSPELAFPDNHFENNNYDHQSWHSTIITFKIHLVYPVGARMSPPARSPPQRPKVP